MPADGFKHETIDADLLRSGEPGVTTSTHARERREAPASHDARSENATSEARSETPKPSARKENLESELDDAPIEVPAPKGKRDYTAFRDPTMAEVARHLPNAAYEKFLANAPKWAEAVEEVKQLREAASKTPSYHFEHPEGYLLTPEWPQLTQAHRALQHETSHWEQQLLAIKRGEDWVDFVGYDQQGQPQYRKISAPADGQIDYRAELHAQQRFAQAAQQFTHVENQASNLMNTYSNRVKQAKESMVQIERKLFPKLELEKLTGQDKEDADLVDQLLSKEVPPEFAKHPATRLAKLMYVTMMKTARRGLEWKTELEKARAQLAGKARAGNTRIPTEGDTEGADDLVDLENI